LKRFWIKVDKKGEEDCWCWCAATVKGVLEEKKLTYGVIGMIEMPLVTQRFF
jgi:hypothetical protein